MRAYLVFLDLTWKNKLHDNLKRLLLISGYIEEVDPNYQISGARYFGSDLVIIIFVSVEFISLLWK